MKKLLIALLVAGVLGGAVYGAAAAITIAPTQLGAGVAQVTTCDDTISLTPVYSFVDGTGWVITSVTIGDYVAACDGDAYDFRLTNGGSTIAGHVYPGILNVGSEPVDIAPDILVSAVTDMDLLVY